MQLETNINFLNGQPSEDLLPTQLFAKAAQKTFTKPNAALDVLQYAHEYGNAEFLENLAEFLSKAYKSPVYSHHLCATPGASLSLEHLLSLLTRPQTATRHVYFQDPTYFLAFNIFLNVGFTRDQFIGVPEQTDTGIDLDILESYLMKHATDHTTDTFNSVLYCVPTHANPTGSILSSDKRKRLVQLGRKYNMLIICDDVYDILTYEGEIIKRLVAYDLQDEHEKHVVVSNGSFSKLLAPGARAGWIETSTDIIQRVGASGSFISGGSPSNLSSQIINEMLKDGSLADNIEFLKKTLSDRLYRGLWGPIQELLVPLGCSVNIRPKGGYFVWLKLPIPGTQLMEAIKKHDLNMNVGLGTQFVVSIDRQAADYYIRLSFAHYNTATLQFGISRLQNALLIALRE